jgi:cell shape-determining protein MreD
VAFVMAALARRTQRWAQLTVLGFLGVTLAVVVFVYPTMFGPEQQTVFGWFENDVYVGLLVTATYLGVQRLRGAALTPA